MAISALLVAVAFARAFLWPAMDRPQHADAVAVLSGDHGERLELALSLIRGRVTRTLVFVGQLDSDRARELCERGDESFTVVCLRPQPDSTRAEARSFASLARSRGWRTIVVSTTTYHITRTRLLFARCFGGDVSVVGSPPPFDRATSVRAIGHEVGGLAYAVTIGRGC